MAFPAIQGSATTANAASTSQAVNLPAGIQVGELLLMFLTTNGGTGTIGVPTGWTSLYNVVNFQGDYNSVGCYRIADGSEGATVTVSLATSNKLGAVVCRISPFDNVATPAAATATTTKDPPSLSPSWGSADNLWLAIEHFGNISGVTSVTSYPTNYTGVADAGNAGANDPHTAIATRALTAATEDPGTYTLQNWSFPGANSATIAVKPGAAANQNAPQLPLLGVG